MNFIDGAARGMSRAASRFHPAAGPAGLSAFQNGDLIELEREGPGRLRFNVRDDLKRRWSRERRPDRHNEGF